VLTPEPAHDLRIKNGSLCILLVAREFIFVLGEMIWVTSDRHVDDLAYDAAQAFISRPQSKRSSLGAMINVAAVE